MTENLWEEKWHESDTCLLRNFLNIIHVISVKSSLFVKHLNGNVFLNIFVMTVSDIYINHSSFEHQLNFIFNSHIINIHLKLQLNVFLRWDSAN